MKKLLDNTHLIKRYLLFWKNGKRSGDPGDAGIEIRHDSGEAKR